MSESDCVNYRMMVAAYYYARYDVAVMVYVISVWHHVVLMHLGTLANGNVKSASLDGTEENGFRRCRGRAAAGTGHPLEELRCWRDPF